MSSARKKNAAQTKRRWAEQRRTAKRQTKCEAKVKLAEDKQRIRQAWKKLQEMQLVPKPMRSYRQFPCQQCAANCVCRPVLDNRDRAAFREELKRHGMPEHTVYFRGSNCCRLFSCLRFTALPVKKTRWPLALVVGFVEEFMQMAKPNLQEVCRRSGQQVHHQQKALPVSAGERSSARVQPHEFLKAARSVGRISSNVRGATSMLLCGGWCSVRRTTRYPKCWYT